METFSVSTIDSGADQRKHRSSASLAFVRGISGHKWLLTRKMFPFDDVIMIYQQHTVYQVRISSLMITQINRLVFYWLLI